MSLPPDVRLVAVDVDFLTQLGTRTKDGRLITAEWGEPDENGRYMPTFTSTDDGMMLVSRADCLDSAWAEAEAALPEGWVNGPTLFGYATFDGDRYYAANITYQPGPRRRAVHVSGDASTPAAALRALAVKLREAQP